MNREAERNGQRDIFSNLNKSLNLFWNQIFLLCKMWQLNYLIYSSSILSCYASPMGWSQSGWAHNYLPTNRYPTFSRNFDAAAICEISFILHCDRIMTFTQFLPNIKEKGLDFTYWARSNHPGSHSHHSKFPYLHCSGRLEQGLPGLLWACGFMKNARGEAARAQSALYGTLMRDRTGADVGENMCWFTSDPRQREEILTRYHSRKKQGQWSFLLKKKHLQNGLI